MKTGPQHIVRGRVKVYVYILLPTISSDELVAGLGLKRDCFIPDFPLQSFRPKNRRGDTQFFRTKVLSDPMF